MLGLAPDKGCPRYVSLRGSLTAPVVLYPLLGGARMDIVSFGAVLVVVVLAIGAAMLALGLTGACSGE